MRHFTPLKLLMGLLSAAWLSGCAFAPGSHFDAASKHAPVDDLVDVEPITLGLVSQQQSAPDEQDLKRITDAQREAMRGYDYRIGKGDVLSIIVYDHPELTIPAGSERSAAESGNTVQPDGNIYYPYIGEVAVEDKTVSQVRQAISRQLEEYIAAPQVEVRIAAYNSQDVVVSGQVQEPGRLPITNVPMTLLDAISMSGGLGPQANWHGVQLTRDGQTRTIDVYEMLNQGNLSQDILLEDEDVLHVPDLGDQQVFVMGEVGEPQALPMGRSPITLTEALSRSGSIDEAQADASGIFVFRRNTQRQDKLATVYQLDASNATAMVLGTQFQLEPSDVVYVTTTALGRWNRTINQLLPTVTAIYQVTRTARDANDLQDDF
ncbi:polysaccharide export protein [Halomonas sp. 18H]|uniref:polysaccharide export protein n=1 Tax=Halomonas almeriensis TaxID=308163 RepID=UPI002231F287|nr:MULTISPECIES: polysaccharide export protein [Halomonas]MCW4152155.1 polysaccharide export protein [Halomonas sp. 18H]MDN3552585.1 polysaccharide export protein [Halomonas almeriensis]